MPRFDLYRLPGRTSGAGERATLVVDVQSAHLDYLESRVVVPLRLSAGAKPVTELHPVLHVEGDLYILVTHALTAVRRRDLGHPIANVAAHRDQIVRALDILTTGF